MSLAFEDDKILTSNPFIDLLLYNLKILSFNSIIKDEDTADKNETLDSVKNSDLYIACYENHAEVALFKYIPHDILVEAGVPSEQIALYEKNDEYDPYYLPEKYHSAILKLAQPWYMEQYVELNEYYRMITGQPPIGDPGIPMRDYEYLLSDDLLDYTGEFVHETGTDFCRMLDNMGILDIIKADFPDAKYLNYVTQGLDIYTVRTKMDFQILYYPTDCDIAVTQEFLFKYEENRKYVLATVYSYAMELESEHYHSFMMIYLVLITMLDMLMEIQSHIVKKDILDRRCIQYIFSIYGIPYYRVIPYKYQERMCKNVWSLVKYKSCTQEMLNLIDLFGFDDIHIFKYYILKVRQTNAWGEFEYNTSTKLVCNYNNIIEHTTLEEKLSDPSTQPPIPPNLDWYERNKATTTGYKVDYSNNLINYNDEDEVISSTIQALENDSSEYDKDNNDYLISTLAEGDVVRYINYPFDYFLQKGNVMFVNVDGRILVEGVDYTISNYNTITFHNGVVDGKSTVKYEFYYDKDTVDQDFKVDTSHAINMDTKQYTKCKQGQVFDLDPIKWYNYLPYENQVIVSVSSVFLPPALYEIDFDNHTLTIDDSVPIDGRVVTIILLYSGSLKTQFEKHNVESVQEEQTDFFIPEPFQHYCLNENKFFITMGSVYVNQNRYQINASTEKGQSTIHFTDGTRVPRGRSLTFNFLYSTNAIWNPLVVQTKTIHIVATQYYQIQFDIDFPVNNYLDCRYKVFIKLLGWYLPEQMFEIVGNGITFTDQSIALQPYDEMDVILVYVDADRSDGHSNIQVNTDYRVAEQDKQSKYDIVFPTEHYHTKGNVVLVDVEGIYLKENVDYTIDYNDANGGKEGTVTLLTYDYKPMKGQRVNYTFYWNQEAEYYAMIDQQQIPIESPGQNKFTLDFPFFPYVQTGNDFIVMSGSTLVTKDRITWADQFNIQIEGLDPEESGGYITVLYIYNNYYLLNHEEDLIVEWKDAAILSDTPYVEIIPPFEGYLENDWPYFTTYGDRLYIDESKYDVFDNSWYANPPSDLYGYGNNLTFVFIYLKREPYVVEMDVEDYEADMDLKFCKIPIEDLYSSQYLKDPTNWKDYDMITYQDGWWDGYQYKQNNHQLVIDQIYQQKWNYARAKYYGLYQTMDVVKYSSMISYFYSMLYDDVLLEEELKVKVDSLSPYHTFRLADLFIYMTCLTYIFNGLEDFVLDDPGKIMFVQGFNFRASFKELKKYLRYHHEEEDKFDVWDFIIPTQQIPDLEEFMHILNTNWDVRTELVQSMIDSEDYREYHIWKHFYDTLMLWQYNQKFFTLENGEVAKTYTEFLKEKDSVLYNSLQEIKAMGNYEEQVDYIVQIVDDIVYVLDEFINGEWSCVFDRFPGQSPTDALKYLLLVISFFKSYKIVFLSKGIQMEIGQSGKPDEDTFMKGMDLCRIKKTDNIITYYPLVEDVKTTRHLGLYERFREHENGKWMREDFTITRHGKFTVTKDISGNVTLIPTYYKEDIISGSLIVEKQEFKQDIIYGSLNIDKIDYTYWLFGNGVQFEYKEGQGNEDIDSDVNINKEEFYKDILIDNTVQLVWTEFTDEDGKASIDGNLELVWSEVDPEDDRYIIDGMLNVDKLYPSDDDLEDHYTITGDLNIDAEYVDPEDKNYIIDGMVNTDKLYPTEEDLNDHYTIDGTVITDSIKVDGTDPEYNIDGQLDLVWSEIDPEDDRYIIDGTFEYAQGQLDPTNDDYVISGDLNVDGTYVDPDDDRYIIDGNLNIDKLYPSDEELEDNYTITGDTNIDRVDIDPDDEDYIISGDLNIDLEEVPEDDEDYIINGEFELVNTEFTDEDGDASIDGNLNIDAEYPDDSDEDYIISGSLDVYGYELPEDDAYAIDGQVTIEKDYPDDEDESYIISGDLNVDKEYPTEEELDDNYTITGDLKIEGIEIPVDEGYIIDGTLNIDKEYPDESDEDYIISGDMTYEQGEPDPDDEDYVITGDVSIDNEVVDEDDPDYVIDGELIVGGIETEPDDNYMISGDLNVDAEYPEEDDENYLIDGKLDLVFTEVDPDDEDYVIPGTVDIEGTPVDEDDPDYVIDGELNINKEYPSTMDDNYMISGQAIIDDYSVINKDIDSEVTIDEEELDQDLYIEFNIDNLEFSTDIDGNVTIDEEELDYDFDITFEVPNQEFNTDIDGTLEYINIEYKKQNILEGYEFVYNTTSHGGGVEQDILTGSLYYSSVNRGYYLDGTMDYQEQSITSLISSSASIYQLSDNAWIDGTVELEEGYTDFNILSAYCGAQQGIAYKRVPSTIQFPVTVVVDDISHLVNENGEFHDIKAVSFALSDFNITNRTFDVTGVNGNTINILVTLTGTWPDDYSYNGYFYISDDLGNEHRTPGIVIRVTTTEYEDPDTPLTGGISIESSSDRDRRQLTVSYNSSKGGYYFTTDYNGWDVTCVNGLTIDQLDLDNIEMSIDSVTCNSQSWSSATERYVTYNGHTDKGSTTKFGINFTVSDVIQSLMQNYDYTLNVTVPAADGYSGSVSTQFTIKLQIR